jgi:TonB family protein
VNCEACATELQQFEASLHEFRRVVTRLADEVSAASPEFAWKQRLTAETEASARQSKSTGAYATTVVATASVFNPGEIRPLDRFVESPDWERAWYRRLWHDFSEWTSPKEIVQLGVASVALPVREIKIYTSGGAKAGMCSAAIHAGLIGLVLLIAAVQPAGITAMKQVRTTIIADLRPYLPPAHQQSGGGGGGGAGEVTPPSKGSLPRPSPRPFLPPRVDRVEARLQLPAAIVVPEDLTETPATDFGDLQSKLGVPSNGPGLYAGIGTGGVNGVGDGRGPGAGLGTNSGFNDGIYHIGGEVSAPKVLRRVEPEYSEEARKAKWQGTVLLSVIIDDHGIVQAVKVVRSLGLGLDENAITAVKQWRFKPGIKGGKPVPVNALLEVNYRLL